LESQVPQGSIYPTGTRFHIPDFSLISGSPGDKASTRSRAPRHAGNLSRKPRLPSVSPCTGSRLPGLTRQGGKRTLQRPKNPGSSPLKHGERSLSHIIMILSLPLSLPAAKCGCKKFLLDTHGDHISTCTAHSLQIVHPDVPDVNADRDYNTHVVMHNMHVVNAQHACCCPWSCCPLHV